MKYFNSKTKMQSNKTFDTDMEVDSVISEAQWRRIEYAWLLTKKHFEYDEENISEERTLNHRIGILEIFLKDSNDLELFIRGMKVRNLKSAIQSPSKMHKRKSNNNNKMKVEKSHIKSVVKNSDMKSGLKNDSCLFSEQFASCVSLL